MQKGRLNELSERRPRAHQECSQSYEAARERHRSRGQLQPRARERLEFQPPRKSERSALVAPERRAFWLRRRQSRGSRNPVSNSKQRQRFCTSWGSSAAGAPCRAQTQKTELRLRVVPEPPCARQQQKSSLVEKIFEQLPTFHVAKQPFIAIAASMPNPLPSRPNALEHHTEQAQSSVVGWLHVHSAEDL